MSQTKLGSFVEAWVNIVVGFSINYAMNALVFGPLLGVKIPARANIVYGVIMTIVSLVRGFTLRRFFNSMSFGNKP